MLKYKYSETEKIKSLIIEVEALKIVFKNLQMLPNIEQNLRRESLLKSSVYSARVEGNPLMPENIESGEKIHKLEISNLLTSYNYIYSKRVPNKLSLFLIKNIHKLVMKNIPGKAGSFRQEPWGIFNSAGIAVYLAPAHFKLPELMQELLEIERQFKGTIPVKAAILQFLFEKVHPFADGNGRIGRLISAFTMNNGGYGFKGLIPIEEVIDNNRADYYSALEPNSDVTLFVEFFLQSFVDSAKMTLEKASSIKEEKPEDILPLRRQEIVRIIKDHPYASANLIFRRFPKVNQKTLLYDLGQLLKSGFVVKVGKTRGVTYLIKDKKLETHGG